jgi:hypothetical protein
MQKLAKKSTNERFRTHFFDYLYVVYLSSKEINSVLTKNGPNFTNSFV